jgi:hypothetical protein
MRRDDAVAKTLTAGGQMGLSHEQMTEILNAHPHQAPPGCEGKYGFERTAFMSRSPSIRGTTQPKKTLDCAAEFRFALLRASRALPC